MADILRLFIDTNAFLQLRDLKDLPWRDLVPGIAAIDLFVSPPVVAELDRLKVSGKDRIRNRSRTALHQIDNASEATEMALVLRSSDPTIRLVLPDTRRPNWRDLPDLDPDVPDDQIVAAAITFGPEAAIFSVDSRPRISARRARLRAYSPPEAWLLPPEPSPDKLRIRELERNIERAMSRAPAIGAGLGSKEKPIQHLDFEVPRLPPLTATQVEELVRHHTAEITRDPYRINMSMPRAIYFAGEERDNDYERYAAAVRKFIESINSFYRKLHERIAQAAHICELDFWIENTGSIAADDLRVQATVSSGAHLSVGLSAASEREIQHPIAPSKNRYEKPSAQWPARSIKASDIQYHPEDPSGMKWLDPNSKAAYSQVMVCESFHASRYVNCSIGLHVKDAPYQGKVSVEIGASNLAQPLRLEATFRANAVPSSWADPTVLDLIPPALRKVVAAAAA